MTCTTCKGELDEKSKFCSRCGEPVSASATGPFAPEKRQIESMLAEANLMRMRANWIDAENRCIDVIHLEANNVHSHSLLGDIYRDQGKLEEAAQWYRMALDLDPDSQADRAKLAHVEREKAKLDAARAEPSVVSGSPVRGTQKLMGVVSPQIALRTLTAVSVVFAILVVALVLASRANRAGATRGPSVMSGGSSQGARETAAGQYGSPVPTPMISGATSASSAQTGRSANSPSSSQSQPTVVTGYSARETALRSQLNRQFGQSDASVDAVTVDAQRRHVNVVLTYRRPDADAETLRKDLPELGMRAAIAVFSSDLAWHDVSISVRADLGSSRPEPAFGGDVERTAVSGASGTQGSPTSAFVYSWWAPALSGGSGMQDTRSIGSGVN